MCNFAPRTALAKLELSGGDSSGGGGTVCRIQNEHLLLDLALLKSPFYDPPVLSDTLLTSLLTEEIGFSPLIAEIDLKESLGLAKAKIAAWGDRKNPYDPTTNILFSALSTLHFYKARCGTSNPVRYYLPQDSVCKKSDLIPVMFYQYGKVFISMPEWNRLGLQSKGALLVHEALRQLQILDHYSGSDQELEELALKIWQGPAVASQAILSDPFFERLRNGRILSSDAMISNLMSDAHQNGFDHNLEVLSLYLKHKALRNQGVYFSDAEINVFEQKLDFYKKSFGNFFSIVSIKLSFHLFYYE